MENEEIKGVPKNPTPPIGIPFLYSNGVVVNLTVADISLNITINGNITHILNMSLPTAKALVNNLNAAITDYERRTETKVLTPSEVALKLKNTSK